MARTKELLNRKQLIVDAASELFARFTYEKTTVDEIAKLAGISKGAVYLEFPHKEEILVFMVRQLKDAETIIIENQIEHARPPILGALKNICMEHFLRIYDRTVGQKRNPEVMTKVNRRLKTEVNYFLIFREQMVRLMAMAAEHGELAPRESYTKLADQFMAGFVTLMPPYPRTSTVYGDESVPRDVFERNASDLLDLLIAGMTATTME
jgi:AcrR family transcriptional regulator